jgi:hypothetical protein
MSASSFPRFTVRQLALAAALLSPLGLALPAFGQGCMATRVTPPILGGREDGLGLQKGQWEFSTTYRFYEAERHFYDDNKEVVPANAPRVVRNVLDFTLTYALSDRTTISAGLPLQTGRFDRRPIPPYGASVDKAEGIGDLAVVVRHWMFDPETHHKYNVRLGAGVKVPTGSHDVETWRRYNNAPRGAPANYVEGYGPADVAIQPGDGGVGVLLTAEGFYMVGEKTSLYGEFTYLLNPQDTNGTNNQWSGSGPYVPNIDTTIPDYFVGRAGFTFIDPLGWKKGTALLGLRIEGQPVHDVFGSDEGFRRPGYSLSVEPGVAYSFSKVNVFLSVPITIYRQRWLSVDEERAGRTTAVSAAFADYNIIAGMSYRW